VTGAKRGPKLRNAVALPAIEHEVIESPEAKAIEAALYRTEASYRAERDDANELLGMIRMAAASKSLFGGFELSKLADIKQRKLYKALRGRAMPGREDPCAGTWEDFCQLLGRARAQVDEDLKNFQAFGEEALRSMTAAGLGYRQLRQLSKSPEEPKLALIEAAQQGDKDQLLDLAEQLLAHHAAERQTLAAERARLNEELDHERERVSERDKTIERQATEISRERDAKMRALRAISEQAPDEQREALRAYVLKAAGMIKAYTNPGECAEHSTLAATFRDLQAYARESNVGEPDENEFIEGVVNDLIDSLNFVLAVHLRRQLKPQDVLKASRAEAQAE
jgi:hypothetical protein